MDAANKLCERAWKKGEVPDDWKKAIIVPLNKGKGSRSECSSYRGISLLSVYGRILTERLVEVTEGKVSEEQGGFRKGRGCVDQTFAMKRLVEVKMGDIHSDCAWPWRSSKGLKVANE